MSKRLFALLPLLAVAGCAQINETLNRVQRTWDNSPKTVVLYSMDGKVVKSYDIGRDKVTRAEGEGDYIYFYSQGKYVQTNMPYIVESK